MEKDKFITILQELYDWNPKLRSKEKELLSLIKTLADSRPDTQFDEQFAADLKKDLLSHRILLDDDEGLEEKFNLFNFNYMRKKLYFGLGAVALCGVAFLFILINKQPGSEVSWNPKESFSNYDQFVKTEPGAFGSLAKLNQAESQELTASNLQAGGDTVTTNRNNETVVSSASAPILGMGGDGVDYLKMILPMHSFEYIYVGEPLELSEEEALVYRRLKGDGSLSHQFDSLFAGKKVGPLDLQNFSGLQTNSISFNENKPFGYSMSIDFKEESIYIGQNWSYWQHEINNCGGDQACFDSYRLKIEDVLSDEELIAIADKFLSDKKINHDSYDEAQIDNFWRLNYEASQDKDNYYIPEEISVIYPLKIDEQKVYDQGGDFMGLRVNVNLRHKLVSGVSNLNTARFETSKYILETDAEKIIGAALKNGSRFYYTDDIEKVSLELGTPSKALVRYWRYENNTSEELLVPALIFPVNNPSASYYGSRYITIPLVKEMLEEIINNNSGGDIGIMPLVR